LRKSQQLLQSTLDALSIHIAILDQTGTIIGVNAAWRRFAADNGYNDSSYGVGVNYLALCEAASGEDADMEISQAVGRGIQEVITNRRDEFEIEYPCHSPSQERWFVVRVTRIAGAGPGRALVAHENLTTSKQAEQRLQRIERQQRAMLDTLPDLFWLKDPDGRYQIVNRAFCVFHGLSREEVVGKTADELFAPAIVSGIRAGDRAIIEQGGVTRDIVRTFNSGTATGWVETTKGLVYDQQGVLLGIVGTTRDITERKLLEEKVRASEEQRLRFERRLLEAQRLESLGILAGGIAHDFNNLLSGILGYAELALQDLPATASARTDIEAVISAAYDAAQLTNQMLAYSGKGHFVVQTVYLDRLIKDTNELLEASIAKHCLVRYRFADELPAIEADIRQLRQAILNVLTNAAEAIGAAGGTIMLLTAVEHLTREALDHLMFGADLAPGRYVRLTVIDSGQGMDEKTLARIFDPFFTTKFTGRGLGLAAVQGIVRGHRGALSVSSDPHQGTVFSIWFPALNEPSKTMPATNQGHAEHSESHMI
jgi:two-component system, cell cycle sensor histidine kinase and response regulator CckA